MKKPDERVLNFVEEFGWLLRSYQNLDYEDLGRMIRRVRALSTPKLDEYAPQNPNIAFLVGMLPTLFQDRGLFPQNEDIAEFSERALGIPITRYKKRSQYELIGFVVCEVTRLDDLKLSRVVSELKRLVQTSGGKVSSESNIGAWNDAIRRLTGLEEDDNKKHH